MSQFVQETLILAGHLNSHVPWVSRIGCFIASDPRLTSSRNTIHAINGGNKNWKNSAICWSFSLSSSGDVERERAREGWGSEDKGFYCSTKLL